MVPRVESASGLCVLLLVLLCGCTVTNEFDLPRSGQVSSSGRTPVHADPTPQSPLVAELYPGTVVEVTARRRQVLTKKEEWYRLRTRSGRTGWCEGRCVRFVTDEEAEAAVLRDRQRLAARLRAMVLTAGREAILESGVRPAAEIQRMWISQPLETSTSSPERTIRVSAEMVGTILGINRYQVDVDVRIFLDLNRDFLEYSEAEVSSAAIVGDRPVREFSIRESVGILSLLGF